MAPQRPEEVIGEVLGEPAAGMRNPANAHYLCPFLDGACTKRSHRIEGPYPVCSVWHHKRNPKLICTCPKRFFEIDLLADILEHCWPGNPPQNPRLVHEVSMGAFGTVDLVVADVAADADVAKSRSVRQFVSVELQAVDTTGSVYQYYEALLKNEERADGSFGINWANVRKRYINQLIVKSYYHHQWDTRVVAVMQTQLYNYLRENMQFDEIEPDGGRADVIFLLYDYEVNFEGGENPDDGENHRLVLQRVVRTSHSSLMTSSLYQPPLKRDEFIQHILGRL